MIPADVASRLRFIAQDQPPPPQPVASAGKLTDVLSELVPGQRIMAEIQALLPNGSYRAIVTQRDITLALPFAAKPGDALELKVVESNGKLTLAFVANHTAAGQAPQKNVSVTPELSQAGQLISELLCPIDAEGDKPQPVTLNGNQPLLGDFPEDTAEVVKVLKNAVARSGMFYESHQANWVEGRLPTEALRQEPQGKHSNPEPIPDPRSSRGGIPVVESGLDGVKAAAQSALPTDLVPLVRQQLDALATQNHVWQGQIWPGQQMHWEIKEDGENGQSNADNSDRQQWQTRLKLNLPGLGSVDATLRLRGGIIDIQVLTESDQGHQKLAAAGERLRQQFEDAGLNLAILAIHHGEIPG